MSETDLPYLCLTCRAKKVASKSKSKAKKPAQKSKKCAQAEKKPSPKPKPSKDSSVGSDSEAKSKDELIKKVQTSKDVKGSKSGVVASGSQVDDASNKPKVVH